ncbi:MAG: Rnf-Nqr domain containing protein [Pseudomonadota bacterium]
MIAEHLLLVIGGALTANLTLTYLTGLDVLAETTHSVRAATKMGVRVGIGLFASSLLGCMVQRFVLAPYELTYLQLPALVLIIGAVCAGMRMYLERIPQSEQPPDERTAASCEALCDAEHARPAVYQQAITLVGGSATLAAALLILRAEPTLIQSIALSVGMAASLATVLIVFTDLRQRLDHLLIPRAFRGAPVHLLLLGMMALALSGLSGIAG